MGTPQGQRQSQSQIARAQALCARARGLRSALGFARSLAWGGGGLLALVGVAVAGFALPGLARLGLLVVAVAALVWLSRRVPPGAEQAALLPVAWAVVGWLVLAWGLGLLSPIVLGGLVVVAGAGGGLWWAYGNLVKAEERALGVAVADEVVDEAPLGPTPDEILAALLDDAPLEGLEFGRICEEMAPHWSRETVRTRLAERAWKVAHGRWRAKPRGA